MTQTYLVGAKTINENRIPLEYLALFSIKIAEQSHFRQNLRPLPMCSKGIIHVIYERAGSLVQRFLFII